MQDVAPLDLEENHRTTMRVEETESRITASVMVGNTTFLASRMLKSGHPPPVLQHFESIPFN